MPPENNTNPTDSTPENLTTPPAPKSIQPSSTEFLPNAEPQTVGSTGTAVAATKKSKKPLFVGLAVLGALLVGGTAGALWWTSPQKTFEDATAVSGATVKGGNFKTNMTVTPSSGPDVVFDLDSNVNGLNSNTSIAMKVNAGAMKLDMTGGFATDTSKNIYFKVNDVRKTVNSFAGGNEAAIEQYYGSLIDKIDGKWVQMTEADIKEATKDSGFDMSCGVDVIGKMYTDKSYTDDLAKVYANNNFFSIKETLASEKIGGRDSHHYKLTLDKTKYEAFNKAMKNSKIFTELKKCATEPESLDSSTDSKKGTINDPTIELWVDKWNHQPTKLMIAQSEEGTTAKITMTMNFNNNQKVETPKAETQYKDLQKEIQSIQSQFQSQSSVEEFDTTVLGDSIVRGL